MCKELEHLCYCGTLYECALPNWACPSINNDEDGYMCEECLAKFAKSYAAFIDKEELTDVCYRIP